MTAYHFDLEKNLYCEKMRKYVFRFITTTCVTVKGYCPNLISPDDMKFLLLINDYSKRVTLFVIRVAEGLRWGLNHMIWLYLILKRNNLD